MSQHFPECLKISAESIYVYKFGYKTNKQTKPTETKIDKPILKEVRYFGDKLAKLTDL